MYRTISAPLDTHNNHQNEESDAELTLSTSTRLGVPPILEIFLAAPSASVVFSGAVRSRL